MNLPEESIASWGELCEQFFANFRGMYERPKESLHKYIQRFS
jgi:hypothetical protein